MRGHDFIGLAVAWGLSGCHGAGAVDSEPGPGPEPQCEAGCTEALVLSRPEGFVEAHGCVDGACLPMSRTVAEITTDTAPSNGGITMVWLWQLEPATSGLSGSIVTDGYCTLIVGSDPPIMQHAPNGATVTVAASSFSMELEDADVADELPPLMPGDTVSVDLQGGTESASTSLVVPQLQNVLVDTLSKGEPWRISWTPADNAHEVRVTYWDNFDEENGESKRTLFCAAPAELGEVVVSAALTSRFTDTTSSQTSVLVSAKAVTEWRSSTEAQITAVRLGRVDTVLGAYQH